MYVQDFVISGISYEVSMTRLKFILTLPIVMLLVLPAGAQSVNFKE